jgi:hypothetical protein
MWMVPEPETRMKETARPLLSLHRDLELEDIFTQREVEVARRLQATCEDRSVAEATAMAEAFERGLINLGSIAMAYESYPSLRDERRLGRSQRTGQTLMERLLVGGEHALEWSLPTKALLSRTFGIAKVNFWTGLKYLAEESEGHLRPLLGHIQDCIEESVYIRLAEELYGSFVTSRTTSLEIKRVAITHLIDLWEGRIRAATDRFCPILRSAWAARCRAPRAFGTMMGASEIVGLLFKECPQRFIEWFARDSHDSEQLEAFEEFIFDLPFESLDKIRLLMREEGKSAVTVADVERYLGMPIGGLRPLIEDPRELYTSFRRRRVKAQYRSSMRIPGPKRTAESYVLESLLAETLTADC